MTCLMVLRMRTSLTAVHSVAVVVATRELRSSMANSTVARPERTAEVPSLSRLTELVDRQGPGWIRVEMRR